MPFDLDESVAVLVRTPATLRALLQDLPEGWSVRCGSRARTALDAGATPHSAR